MWDPYSLTLEEAAKIDYIYLNLKYTEHLLFITKFFFIDQNNMLEIEVVM